MWQSVKWLTGWPGTVGFAGLDFAWRRSQNPEESLASSALHVGAATLAWEMAGPAAWALTLGYVGAELGGRGMSYLRNRQVARHEMFMSPNLGGQFSGFQMTRPNQMMQAYGLRQIQESKRYMGAALGQEAMYYNR